MAWRFRYPLWFCPPTPHPHPAPPPILPDFEMQKFSIFSPKPASIRSANHYCFPTIHKQPERFKSFADLNKNVVQTKQRYNENFMGSLTNKLVAYKSLGKDRYWLNPEISLK